MITHVSMWLNKTSLNFNYLFCLNISLPINPDAMHAPPPITMETNNGFFLPSGFRINIQSIYDGISTAPAIQKLMYGSPPISSVPSVKP